MPRGGKRIGAGRKPKALAEKLLDGNPGKREIKINKFSGLNENIKYKTVQEPQGNGVPKRPREIGDFSIRSLEIPEYLEMASKEGGDNLPKAGDIYTFISEFVLSSGCGHLVNDFLLEDFTFLRRAYLECEYMNKKNGRIALKKRSPYVDMAIDYHKEMMTVFNQIWGVVSKNSETSYESKNDFFEILRNRGF